MADTRERELVYAVLEVPSIGCALVRVKPQARELPWASEGHCQFSRDFAPCRCEATRWIANCCAAELPSNVRYQQVLGGRRCSGRFFDRPTAEVAEQAVSATLVSIKTGLKGHRQRHGRQCMGLVIIAIAAASYIQLQEALGHELHRLALRVDVVALLGESN